MKKLTRLLSALLAVAVLVSSCAGCGSKTDGSTSASQGNTAAAPAQTKELVWWMIGPEPKDLAAVNAKVNEYTKSKLNVTVKFKYANWGDYSKKLTTVIQSGEKYDIAFGTSINNYIDLARKIIM